MEALVARANQLQARYANLLTEIELLKKTSFEESKLEQKEIIPKDINGNGEDEVKKDRMVSRHNQVSIQKDSFDDAAEDENQPQNKNQSTHKEKSRQNDIEEEIVLLAAKKKKDPPGYLFEEASFERNHVPTSNATATTPVHTRLFKRGAEREAKLQSLREQFEELTSHSNIPKINDTSRRMVEATRRRSNSIQVNMPTEDKISDEEDKRIDKPEWREFATPEGHLYYYNEITKQTSWFQPNSFIPYVPSSQKHSTSKRRYSLDQAKLFLSKAQQ